MEVFNEVINKTPMRRSGGGFTKNNSEIQKLRNQTFRSHVQIHWNDETTVENPLLRSTLSKLKTSAKNFDVWNTSIIDMVRLYFVDM